MVDGTVVAHGCSSFASNTSNDESETYCVNAVGDTIWTAETILQNDDV